MAVPSQAELYRPILEILASASGGVAPKPLTELVSDRFNLSDADRQEMIPSGITSRIYDRTSWACMYLRDAGLLYYPPRGPREITPQGQEFLDSHAGAITNADLPRLQQANGAKADTTDTSSGSVESSAEATPEELMAQSDRQLRAKLADELLESIMKLTPDRFEQLVVNLLEKMGYGEGQAVGRSGDGGIDGIINQDPLGLEKVYIQAKRWSNQVGEPEVRNFSGSLDAKGAAKGVFITNSTFSNTAKETARNISAGNKLICLINGQELVKLMIQHGVGVVTESTYEVKKMDENYFAEDV